MSERFESDRQIGVSGRSRDQVESATAVADPSLGGFAPANDLLIGDALVLAEGREATVLSINEQLAPAGETFTTYNFAVEDHHTYFVGESGVWVHNAGNPCDEAFELFAKMVREGRNQTEAYVESLRMLLKHGDEGLALIRKHVADLDQYVTNALKHALGKDYPEAPDSLIDLVARKKLIPDADLPVDRDIPDGLEDRFLNRRNRKGNPNRPGSVQDHHLIPQEFKDMMDGLDIEVDDFLIPLDYETHIGGAVGIHRKGYDEWIGNFNKRWKDFLQDKDGNPLPRTRKEILDEAAKIVKEFGLDD